MPQKRYRPEEIVAKLPRLALADRTQSAGLHSETSSERPGRFRAAG